MSGAQGQALAPMMPGDGRRIVQKRLLFTFACFFPLASAMAATESPAGDIEAQAPVSLSAEGCAAWRANRGVLSIEGKAEEGGLSGPFSRSVDVQTGRRVERSDYGVFATATGDDGRTAWFQDMSRGSHNLDSTFAVRIAKADSWLSRRGWCSPGLGGATAVQLVPVEEAGRSFRVWRVTPAGGAAIELWFDRRTGRLDRAVEQLSQSRLIRRYSNWRDIGRGLAVPFSEVAEYPEDETTITYTVTRARLSRTPSRGVFSRPASPTDYRLRSKAPFTTVGYEDDGRSRVYVPVYLDGRGPFTFELDSGGHFILSSETARSAGYTPSGEFSSSGASPVISRAGYVRIAEIRIGDAIIRDQPAKVLPFSFASSDRGPRPPRAGVLGLELFERFAVALDRKSKTMTLTPLSSGRPIRGKGTPVPIRFAEDAPLVAGSFQGVSGEFMLDIGNAGPVIIEHHWAAQNGLVGFFSGGVKVGGVTVGSATLGLGPFVLPHEVVTYHGPQPAGSESMRAAAGIFGEPTLSEFNTIYDYGRRRVWFEKVARIVAKPFNRTGLTLTKKADGLFTVASVLPHSPAGDAGIEPGDAIEAINGVAASQFARSDASDLFTRSAGSAIELRVIPKKGGAARSVRIVLRDIL